MAHVCVLPPYHSQLRKTAHRTYLKSFPEFTLVSRPFARPPWQLAPQFLPAAKIETLEQSLYLMYRPITLRSPYSYTEGKSYTL